MNGEGVGQEEEPAGAMTEAADPIFQRWIVVVKGRNMGG